MQQFKTHPDVLRDNLAYFRKTGIRLIHNRQQLDGGSLADA